MNERIKHALTADQARRLNIPPQIVEIVLRKEHEKPASLKHVPIAKDIYLLDGKRVGGILSLNE